MTHKFFKLLDILLFPQGLHFEKYINNNCFNLSIDLCWPYINYPNAGQCKRSVVNEEQVFLEICEQVAASEDHAADKLKNTTKPTGSWANFVKKMSSTYKSNNICDAVAEVEDNDLKTLARDWINFYGKISRGLESRSSLSCWSCKEESAWVQRWRNAKQYISGYVWSHSWRIHDLLFQFMNYGLSHLVVQNLCTRSVHRTSINGLVPRYYICNGLLYSQ